MLTATTSSKFWSPLVAELEPYVPGEQPNVSNLVKLNTNENPYPPSPRVAEVYSLSAIDELRFYPDPTSKVLRTTIADYYSAAAGGLSMENVFVGNGSDEVLAHAFQAFFSDREEPLLFPDISYSFYPVYCNLYRVDSIQLPLDETFSIDFSQYRQPNGGIIFPNPNAPTSIGKPLIEIEALLQSNTDTVVLVDEAYIDFGGESVVALVNRYPNLLVVQTLSKSRALAGTRLGFAIGSKELIDGLIRVKDSFNSYPIDRLTEAAGVAAFEDNNYFRDCCEKIINSREWTVTELEKLSFEVLPSQANFVMAKPSGMKAEALFQQLRQRNIIVRFFNKPRIGEYLRITVGTDAEMQALVAALREILAD
jgi:histidinol-phosphate aminotransferase